MAEERKFIEQNGKTFDLERLDLYEIQYRIDKGRLKLQHPNGRYYDASNRYGERIASDATVGNPDFLLAEVVQLQDFPYYEPAGDLRARVYYINNLELDSANTDELRGLITPRLEHALQTGITQGSDVHIKFVFKDNDIVTSKAFTSFKISEEEIFWDLLQQWIDLNTAANTAANANYTHTVTNIQIRIVKEPAGGCAPRKKTSKIGQCKITQQKASNNNCSFIEIFDLLNLGVRRMGRVIGNTIREEFGLPADCLIPITTVLQIYQKYRIEQDTIISITNEATLEKFYSTPNLKNDPSKTCVRDLSLNLHSHYCTVTVITQKQCDKCGKKYIKTHKCNANMVNYWNVKVKKNGKRFLICSDHTEQYNNKDEVMHYDLETHKKKINNGANDHTVHSPYAVGFTRPKSNQFESLVGVKCISDFVSVLLVESKKMEEEDRIANKKKKRTLYVNAYNGANFDHYFLFQEFLKRGLKPEKHIINNGSIISFEHLNIKLFDVCKHLQGSLSDNLQALGCAVQKGEFDHDDPRLLNGWEGMPLELREDCLKYLKSDVLGLKELYDKLNTTVFDEDKVNISSYISTSSLTFNLWKKSIREKFSIQLPDLKQEVAFRQSVRGGRTYKSKHRFKSEQYDGFKNGSVSFDDVTDYCIDADVVSLYPAAMAKYLYPVGDCYELTADDILNSNTPLNKYGLAGKIGIYKITYEANKLLQHSIGGRRDELTNALKWDLKDQISGQWYTSVDIEDMIDNGYKVKVLNGWYWKEVDYVFKDYIEKLFTKKGELAKAGKKGSVEYLLSKLYMNGLYGKNIQRPIYTESRLIKSNTEYWKFWGTHFIKDITPLDTGDGVVWFVSGSPRVSDVKQECITKPTHLGALILAYSRRIMLEYIKEANPHFSAGEDLGAADARQVENDFYYTDTDSLQMHARNAKIIKRLGDKSLGGITDDLGDKCKIIRGLWIAPKLYMLEYIKKGEAAPHYHFRGKGLSTNKLTVEVFENMDAGGSLTNTREFQMKKINIKRNSNQQDIAPFSIVHLTNVTKKVNDRKWVGRDFVRNENFSRPWK